MMIDYDKWQEILSTLRKHKLRTFLTAFGVFWGIYMLVFMLGAGTGLNNGVLYTFDKFARNTLAVWSQRTSKAYDGYQPGRFVRFTSDDVEAIATRFPELEKLSPRLFLPGETLASYKEKSGKFAVRGETEDVVHIFPMETDEGRFINQLDLVEKRKVVVVGTGVKEILFEDEPNWIGKFIKIRGVFFQVIGSLKSAQQGDQGREDEMALYIPISTVQQTFNMAGRVSWFLMAVKAGEDVSKVETNIKKLLARRHSVHPEDDRGIRSFNLEKQFNQFSALFAGINGFIWFVGIGTLLAGIVGVGNIMLITVKERTREIGIRKSIGATPRSIIAMILQESLLLTSVSGYLGLLFGTATVALANYAVSNMEAEGIFFRNPEINLPIVLVALLILIIAGLFAGLIPALNAARINPVVALKEE